MSKKTERIYLSPPHMSGEEEKYIRAAFAANWIAPLGENVDRFEAELAAHAGVAEAAALNSGTAALHLGLQLAGVGKGDRVLCSTLTFVASANAVLYRGAEPVFVDSEPESWNLSPEALERALSTLAGEGRPAAAVMAVNLYGQCCDLELLETICARYGTTLVEDAAESLGATCRGRQSGSFGCLAAYSFNGNKIITTSGGGALLSNDIDLVRRARYLASQARLPAPHYEHGEVGYNYRLSNVLAGIGRAQLAVLEERVEARRSVFERYREALERLPGLTFMPEAPWGRATRWLTALTVDPVRCGVDRDRIIAALEAENIEARPVWKPMHLQPLFEGCRYFTHRPGEDIAAGLFTRGLCLPSGSSLTLAGQDRVIGIVRAQLGAD